MSDITRLKWQCRRGSKELDWLLQTYLETAYLQANEAEKKRFSQLLQWEDCDLLALLLKPVADQPHGLDALVQKIRAG